MKVTRFSEPQIMGIFKQADSRVPVAEPQRAPPGRVLKRDALLLTRSSSQRNQLLKGGTIVKDNIRQHNAFGVYPKNGSNFTWILATCQFEI